MDGNVPARTRAHGHPTREVPLDLWPGRPYSGPGRESPLLNVVPGGETQTQGRERETLAVKALAGTVPKTRE